MTAPRLAPPADLVLTGERTLPGIPDENYWFQRHVVAYQHLLGHVGGRTVLDAGCGEGYGLALLAGAGARRVIGVDLDQASVAHARATYADEVVEVHAAELRELPLADHEVDVTVSLQVIEHLHDIPGYLASLRRVTAPGGLVAIGTPNRLTFTPDSDTPTNPFHTIEFTADELCTLLERAGFDLVEVVGVHHGILLSSVEHDSGRTLPQLQLAQDPQQWPTWLRQLVHRIRPSHFEVRPGDLDASLDLLATCRVPA